jgi:hypothetical protein
MEAKFPEITLGQKICEKLKAIYFSDIPCAECHKDVSVKFSDLKQRMRKFYTDKTDLDILRELIRYGTTDIEEIFNM